MKKHASYSHKPFTKTKKSVTSGSNPVIVSGIGCRDSPGKCINMRWKCMEQLVQLHQLFENGGITMEQHDEMQVAIMEELKKL